MKSWIRSRDDLEADIFAITEHKNNMKRQRNRRHGVAQLFNGGEVMARGKLACNGQEGQEKFLDKKSQEGGTGMVAFGELASLLGSGRIGMDKTGLGRWTYMEFKGEEGVSTVVVSGYYHARTTVMNQAQRTSSTDAISPRRKSATTNQGSGFSQTSLIN